MAATDTPATASTERDTEYDADTEALRALVDGFEDGLARIDQTPGMSPGDQLATLAVAGVRALLPMLRDELDRRLA